MTSRRHFLILPGWQGSGEDHWQSHWHKSLPNCLRLEVADWFQPDPKNWLEALNNQVESLEEPVVLIAHSLGCINLVNWAQQACPESLNKIEAALLVAPADVERPGCPAALTPFAPINKSVLPFPALVLGSENDPAASVERIAELATCWQVPYEILGPVGHINTASGHQRWEGGFRWLYQLLKQVERLKKVA